MVASVCVARIDRVGDDASRRPDTATSSVVIASERSIAADSLLQIRAEAGRFTVGSSPWRQKHVTAPSD